MPSFSMALMLQMNILLTAGGGAPLQIQEANPAPGPWSRIAITWAGNGPKDFQEKWEYEISQHPTKPTPKSTPFIRWQHGYKAEIEFESGAKWSEPTYWRIDRPMLVDQTKAIKYCITFRDWVVPVRTKERIVGIRLLNGERLEWSIRFQAPIASGKGSDTASPAPSSAFPPKVGQ